MSLRHVAQRYAGLVLLAALAVMQGWPVRAEATTIDDSAQRPLDLVRASVARVQGIVRSETGRGSETRRAEIRTIAETLFDFEAMSRRVLARHWNDGTPDQQVEFVRLLRSLFGRAYIDVIASRAWVSTTVERESVDGPYAHVRARMSGDVGPEVSIEFRLFKRRDRWAVYDVVHEGASLVGSYRSQFATVLRTSSFAELLERMRSNERQPTGRAETAEALGRRLLLFSVVTERGGR